MDDAQQGAALGGTGALRKPGLAARLLGVIGWLLRWALARTLSVLAFIWRNIQPRRLRVFYRIARSAYGRYLRDDGDAMAGYIAFTGFLAVFPFAIFATALAGMFITPDRSEAIVDALFELAPEHIAQTLAPVVDSVTSGTGQRLVTVSGIGALWVASTSIEAIRIGFDRAYDSEEPRNFFIRRLIAMLFVLLATVVFGLLGLLLIAAPVALAVAETSLGFAAPFGVGVLRYGLALAMLTLFLFQLHLLLPTRRPPRRRLMPGIVTAMVLLMLGAYGFSQYLTTGPAYSITYGTLAGVIVTLVFFYLGGAAILLGAHVNAVLMQFRRPTPADSEA